MLCVCRKVVVKGEQTYVDVLHGEEYASFSGHQQLIIREGFARNVCIVKAFLINEPQKVPKECKNYTSFL